MLSVEPVEVKAFFFRCENRLISGEKVGESGNVKLASQVKTVRWRESRVKAKLI